MWDSELLSRPFTFPSKVRVNLGLVAKLIASLNSKKHGTTVGPFLLSGSCGSKSVKCQRTTVGKLTARTYPATSSIKSFILEPS